MTRLEKAALAVVDAYMRGGWLVTDEFTELCDAAEDARGERLSAGLRWHGSTTAPREPETTVGDDVPGDTPEPPNAPPLEWGEWFSEFSVVPELATHRRVVKDKASMSHRAGVMPGYCPLCETDEPTTTHPRGHHAEHLEQWARMCG